MNSAEGAERQSLRGGWAPTLIILLLLALFPLTVVTPVAVGYTPINVSITTSNGSTVCGQAPLTGGSWDSADSKCNVPSGFAVAVPYVLTVGAGVTVQSIGESATDQSGVYISGTIINNGTLVGYGGWGADGSDGGNGWCPIGGTGDGEAGGNGGPGGAGVYVDQSGTIYNHGRITAYGTRGGFAGNAGNGASCYEGNDQGGYGGSAGNGGSGVYNDGVIFNYGYITAYGGYGPNGGNGGNGYGNGGYGGNAGDAGEGIWNDRIIYAETGSSMVGYGGNGGSAGTGGQGGIGGASGFTNGGPGLGGGGGDGIYDPGTIYSYVGGIAGYGGTSDGGSIPAPSYDGIYPVNIVGSYTNAWLSLPLSNSTATAGSSTTTTGSSTSVSATAGTGPAAAGAGSVFSYELLVAVNIVALLVVSYALIRSRKGSG